MAAGGYLVESSFVLNDQVSPKLTALILRLDRAQKAFDKCAGSVVLLERAIVSLDTVLGPLNRELSSATRRLGTLGGRAQSVARQLGAGTAAFQQMNNQLIAISTNAANASRGLTVAGIASGRIGAGAARGGYGGGGGGGGGGGRSGFGFPGGGIGGFFGKTMMAMIGFDIAKAGMHPAMEYAQQREGLKSMGLNKEEMGRAERTAAEMQRSMPATNRTDNLKTVKELYGIFRRFDEAIELAPEFAKFSVALQGVGNRVPSMKGHEGEFAQAVAKSAESMGRLSPDQFRDFLNKSLQSYEATGGLVTPLHTAQAIKFSRGARYGKSDDWTFGVLSFLLEESALGKGGGGSRGVGPLVTQIDRTFAQGKMDKRLMQGLADLGLFEGHKAGGDASKQGLYTTTMNTGVTGKLKGMDKLIENPFDWVTKVFEPAMFRKEYKGKSQAEAEKSFYSMTQAQQKAMIQKNAPGLQQQAGDAFYQFIINKKQIELFVENLKKAHTVTESYNEVMKDLPMKTKVVGQELYLLGLQIGTLITPAVGTMMDGMSMLLHKLNDMGRIFPDTAAAFGDFNERLFGATGAFSKLGDSFAKISVSSGPIIKLFDLLASQSLTQTGKSLNKAADIVGTVIEGTQKGDARARGLERRSGVPAWATTGVFETMGAAEALLNKGAGIANRELTRNKHKHDPKLGPFLGDHTAQQQARNMFYTHNAPSGNQILGQGQQVINMYMSFGAVTDLSKLMEHVKAGVSKALAQGQHMFQATTSSAGGIYNNRPLAGGK